MPQNFREASLDQPFLLSQDMRDWLPRTHFAYFVLDLVKQLDASALLGAYRSDGRGARAYHPDGDAEPVDLRLL